MIKNATNHEIMQAVAAHLRERIADRASQHQFDISVKTDQPQRRSIDVPSSDQSWIVVSCQYVLLYLTIKDTTVRISLCSPYNLIENLAIDLNDPKSLDDLGDYIDHLNQWAKEL